MPGLSAMFWDLVQPKVEKIAVGERDMESKINNRAIYWICVLALFTAAMSNSIRAGAAGAMKAALLDPIDALHSGEMIGTVLGSSFLGFALSLLVISPLLDRLGAKKVVLFAAACFIIGPA